ncbi:MAG TPA: ROK family transcriptional regulator [Actinomycetota bacterium]
MPVWEPSDQPVEAAAERLPAPVPMAAGTPSLLRAINERGAVELIRRFGPLSRADIARRSGLSKPTVSLALARLEAAGLVREVGRTSGGRGASAVLYDLDPSAGWVLGIDVGRRWVRCAATDITGRVVARRDEHAHIRSGHTLITQIGSLARAVAADAGIELAAVTWATLGSPGVLGPGGERVILAPNLPGWQQPGVVDEVRAELGLEVEFENDVNLAAIAERWRGLGREVDDFVLLSIGTGIGMGVVLGGQLHRGSAGAAGEVGYLPLPLPPGTGGARARGRRGGAFEAAAGARGVVALARQCGMTKARNAEEVFAAARRGHPDALAAVNLQAHHLALGIAAVAAVLDPDLVILGGGIGHNSGDLLLEPVTRELRGCGPFRPRVAVSALGADAVLQGALATALLAAQERVFARTEQAPALTGRPSPARSASAKEASA